MLRSTSNDKIKKIKKIVEFEEERVTKELWEDAECFECAESFAIKPGPEKAYTYWCKNHGGIQLCKKCFDKLEEPQGDA